MTKRYHLPDWVIDGLADGSVDHLDYTVQNIARVVMRDGSAHDISVAVTPEILEDAFARMQAEIIARRGFCERFRLRVNVNCDQWKGVVTGWTA